MSDAEGGAATLDGSDGAFEMAGNVDWGALKAEVVLALNKLDNQLSVLKVGRRERVARRCLASDPPTATPRARPASSHPSVDPPLTTIPPSPSQIMDSTSTSWPGVEGAVQVRARARFRPPARRRPFATRDTKIARGRPPPLPPLTPAPLVPSP
jgi:hypothetical protein